MTYCCRPERCLYLPTWVIYESVTLGWWQHDRMACIRFTVSIGVQVSTYILCRYWPNKIW